MVVKPADRRPRPLGRTGLQVSPVCIGTSPLASMPALYGYEVAGDRAEATILATLESPFNFMDTSNNYGGSAERRIGRALAAAGGLPPEFVLATKVDADPGTGDFSGDRVKRSVEESLYRLGLDRVPLMYLHDPEYHLTFAEAMARGAVRSSKSTWPRSSRSAGSAVRRKSRAPHCSWRPARAALSPASSWSWMAE